MDTDRMLGDLAQALAAHDEPKVAGLTRDVVGHILGTDEAFPVEVGSEMLDLLLKKRSFTGVTLIGDALLQTGADEPRIRSYYARSLAEQGFLTAAESMARDLMSEASDPDQRTAAQDLLGSIYERMYVKAAEADETTSRRRRSFLERALGRYYPIYQLSPSDRAAQGAKVVALLIRARMDRVELGAYPDPMALAGKVADSVAQSTGASNLMAAIKAAVALEKTEEALRLTDSFVRDPTVEAYDINVLLWELVNVWKLSESGELGGPLLALLKSGLLERPDFSHVEFTPAQAKAAVEGLEKVFGKDGVVTLKWYKNGLERSRSVGKIEDRSGNPKGTGFLVPGSALDPSLGDRVVMITNNHVIATKPDPGIGQLTPASAIVRFQALEEEGESAEVTVSKVLFESAVSDLDASVLELSTVPAGLTPYPIAVQPPVRDGTAKVYVIGHPRGGTLSYSIDDNVLIDYDDRVLHYRSPTEPGSSGSPLFDRNWDLIGLHSRGSDTVERLNDQDGTYAVNVGYRITALAAEMGA